jgi:sarcosine oxidase subunit alpha
MKFTCPSIAVERCGETVLAAVKEFGIMPYGTEAMSTLRIEKGHVVIGPEADGRTTADDLGMGKLVNPRSGASASRCSIVLRWWRRTAGNLVGLTALDGAPMPRAAKIVADPEHPLPNPMQGHVTSWCWSPNLDAWIALALVATAVRDMERYCGQVSPLADAKVRVELGSPCFIDPDGERLRV